MERKINPSLLYNDQNLSQEEKNIVYSNIGINKNVNAVVSSYMNNSASMNNETQYQFLNTVSSDIILVSGQPTSGSFSLMYSINPNYTSSVYFNVNSSYSAVSAVVNSNSSKWISAASGTGPIIAEIDNGKINVSHSAYTTENNIGQTFDTTAYFGSDISLVNVLYDKYGHITSGNGFSVTMPTIYTTTDLSGEGNDDSFLGLNSKVNDNISSGTSAFTWIKNNSSLMTESYLQKASAFGSVNSGNNFNWMLGSGLNPYSQNNSVIIGRYNAQETAFSPVITIGNGTSNTSRNNLYTLSNSGMIIAGFSNTSQDSIGTLIMGDGNIIKNVTLTTSPKNNLIFGHQNTASDATYQFIHGNANLNSGDHSVVIGNANNCYNNYSFIGGLNNVSNGDFDAILGSQNVAPYSWNTCIGSNLSASNTNQLVLGYYNSAISGQAMIVGNGDANTRKNLLMLGYDGTLNLSGSTLNPKDIIAMKTCVNNVSSNSASWSNVVLEKADVGLGNVDNTSDANKPVSIATQTALDLKANQTSISNVDNTSDANKPVSTAQAAAIAAHANLTTGMHGLPALDHFVYGDTAYGGSIVDNLNTLARTMPFTCFGAAVGAPSSDYSWFGWHINSNTGTTAAKQIAWAYNSSIAICYERVKTSSSWGAWTRSGSPAVINSTATDYTFLASDANSCHLINTSASTTRTVPSDSTAPNILIGDSIEVVNVGTGTVTFAAASGVTLLSSLTLVMYGQYSVCMLRKIAANTWILTGERRAI